METLKTYPDRQLEEVSQALKASQSKERIQTAKLVHQQSRYEKLQQEFKEFKERASLAEANHEEALGREIRQKELLWAQLSELEEQQVAAIPDPAPLVELAELKEMLTSSLLENEEVSFSLESALNENGHLALELESTTEKLELTELRLAEAREHVELVKSQRDQANSQLISAKETQQFRDIKLQVRLTEAEQELKELRHALGSMQIENHRLLEELSEKRQQVLSFHLQRGSVQ